jgi:fluoroquinolone resistance protein
MAAGDLRTRWLQALGQRSRRACRCDAGLSFDLAKIVEEMSRCGVDDEMSSRKQVTVTGDARFGIEECAALDFGAAQFEDCAFDHGNLGGRHLAGAKFVDCIFDTCDLVVAKVVDCVFLRVRFRGCRLGGINWSQARKLESVSFENCQLNDGSFLGLRLEDCAFTDCVARGAIFRDANLSKVTFRGSNLAMAEFVNCDLRGADFRGATEYVLSPVENRVEKARVSLPAAMNLLKGFGIVLD